MNPNKGYRLNLEKPIIKLKKIERKNKLIKERGKQK